MTAIVIGIAVIAFLVWLFSGKKRTPVKRDGPMVTVGMTSNEVAEFCFPELFDGDRK